MLETRRHQHNFKGGRVSRRQPCPECGKPDYCEVCSGCGAVHCMRIESEHPYPARLGGWLHRLPERDEWRERSVRWAADDLRRRPVEPSAPPAPPVADKDASHAFYSRLLALCLLSAADRAHLTGPTRQLPADALGDYGTLPAERAAQARIVARLVAEFGAEAAQGMPGVVGDQTCPGGLRLNAAGLLIAVRDVQGRIQACQVRQDRGHRYVWLSTPDVASSGAPAGVVRPPVVRDARVWITEGPIKAAILARQTGAVVVYVAGHALWRAAVPLLLELGADVVVLAFDADDPAKRAGQTVRDVEASGQALAADLAARGFAVRLARWDHAAGKGIDDLLLGGGDYTIAWYRPGIATAPAHGDPDRDPPDPTPEHFQLSVLKDFIKNPAKRRPKNKEIAGDRARKLLTPTDSAVLEVSYVRAAAWPVCGPEEDVPDDVPLRPFPVAYIARSAGVSPEAAGRSLQHLSSDNLRLLSVKQEIHVDPETGQRTTTTLIGGGRRLGWNQEIAESEYRQADRTRPRRCPTCGSKKLHVSQLECISCGATCTPLEAEDAAETWVAPETVTAQPASESASGSREERRASESASGETVAAAAAQDSHALPAGLEGQAAEFAAELCQHRYLDGLEREWHFITGPGGRRYHALSPEDRARLGAVYRSCELAITRPDAPAPPGRSGSLSQAVGS